MSGLFRNILNKFTPAIKNTFKPNAPSLLPVINLKKFSNQPAPYEIIDTEQNKTVQKAIIEKINNQILSKNEGRLFAIVHVAGRQIKVTEGDVIIIEGYWPPTTGDSIKFDKVLLLGAADFTLIGKPLVEDGLVNVAGTVIEKTLSHTKTVFKKKRRKNWKKINFFRIPQTMVRINKVEVIGTLNKPPEVSGLEHNIF